MDFLPVRANPQVREGAHHEKRAFSLTRRLKEKDGVSSGLEKEGGGEGG